VEGAAYHDSSASRAALVPRDFDIRQRIGSVLVDDNTIRPAGSDRHPISLCREPCGLLLRAALAIAFIGTAIAAYSYADARHDLLLSW
jgi:hypothetical protein